MIYSIILSEGGQHQEIELVGDRGDIPKEGDEWPVLLEGKEVRCVIIGLGKPAWKSDGQGDDFIAQELFVRRPVA